MNPSQTENVFAEVKLAALRRKIGVLFFVLAIASFVFAYPGAAYFTDGNFQSKITYAVIAVFLGIVLLICGSILILIPERRLEINLATQRIFHTKKFIRARIEEFSFADVERTRFHQHELENDTSYQTQIILRGGRIIDVPSENLDDEKYQMEIFEQVRKLLSK